MRTKTYTVIGTAPGALALAAELCLRGRRVILTDRPERRSALGSLAANGGLALSVRDDAVFGGRRDTVLDGLEIEPEIAAAVSRADVIVLMVPAPFHEALIDGFGPALRDAQILLIVPGGIGEALMVARIAAAHGAPGLLIGQTAAMPLGGRIEAEGGLAIVSKKRELPVGVFPAGRMPELLDLLGDDFPQFAASGNVIENGFARASIGLHPVPMIMNAAAIERDGPYPYDAYDITPGIARVIDAVDGERQAILAALGAPVTSFSDVLRQSYGVPGNTFYETVHNIASYRQVQSPPDLDYRYLTEDVPTQIVPAASLARALGVATPLMDALIAIAGAIHGVDYWRTGWNLAKLGLEGLTAAEIVTLVNGAPAAAAAG